MSMHKIPLTPIEEAGLRAHGLDIGKPSQLSDVFRQGVRYASAQACQGGEAVAVFAYGSSDGYQPVLPRQSIGSNGERISCYDKPLMTVAQHKRIVAALTPPAPDAELVELLRSKFPRIDPCAPVPLDEKAHCCEYTIYVERERLHRMIDAKLASLKGVEE